jgi:hypothetical protein
MTAGLCQPLHPWSTYDNLVSTLCIAEQASQRAATGQGTVSMPTVGEGFVRGADGRQEPRAGLVEHLAQQRALHLSKHMQRRAGVLHHLPNSNLAIHVGEGLDMERKGLEAYQLQQEVRRALLASHVDVGVSTAPCLPPPLACLRPLPASAPCLPPPLACLRPYLRRRVTPGGGKACRAVHVRAGA